MLSRTILSIVAAGGLLAAQNPQSQSPSSRDQHPADRNLSTQGSSSLSAQDRMWVQKTAMAGHKEVEIAKMAAERASNSELKSFAQRLVDDHTKANQELMQLASQKGVTLSMDKSGAHHTSDSSSSSDASSAPRSDMKDKSMGQFANLTGDKFDRAFVKHMKADHEKDIASFEKQSRSGSDADLKSFAEKTLPTLRAHLDQIKSLEQSMKTPKTSSNN